MRVVGRVIEEGRLSDNGKSYCYLSIYNLKPNKIAVLARLNKIAVCIPPKNLPVIEILITEYWIKK